MSMAMASASSSLAPQVKSLASSSLAQSSLPPQVKSFSSRGSLASSLLPAQFLLPQLVKSSMASPRC